MIYLDLPNISNSGTVEQQLAEIRSYIYRNNEQMNATLSNLTVDKIWEQTTSAISALNSNNEEKSDILSNYQKIRDLVIKTADVIINTDEQLKIAMEGNYLAKSQFGEYLLKTSVDINGESTGFEQLYTYTSNLNSDYGNFKSFQQNFIKEGLLDDSGTEPVYGIEVGLLTEKFTVTKEDGTTETEEVDSNKKLRITPERLSLYDDNMEVAYIEEEKIYFPSACISGGSININERFKVDSEGVMETKDGKFSGEIDASSIISEDLLSRIMLNDGKLLIQEKEKGEDEYDSVFEISKYGQQFYTSNTTLMGGLTRLDYKLDNNFTGNFEDSELDNYIYKGMGTIASVHTCGFIVLAGHAINNNGTNKYISDIVWSYGNFDGITNPYGQMGLHIHTSTYFHNEQTYDLNVKNIKLDGSVISSGYSTVSGKTRIKYVDENNNEYITDLIVRNGLITGIMLNEKF